MSPARLLAEKIGNAVLTKMPKGVFEVPGSHMAFVVWCEQIIQAELNTVYLKGVYDGAEKSHLDNNEFQRFFAEAKKEAYEQGKASGFFDGAIAGSRKAYLSAAKIAEEVQIYHTKEHLDYRTANADLHCGSMFAAKKIAEKLREKAGE